jgi:hypothetical protein
MNYTQAIEEFKTILNKTNAVFLLSEYHKRSKEDIVKNLMMYIIIKRTRKKNIKEVKIKFRDKVSKILIEHKMCFESITF